MTHIDLKDLLTQFTQKPIATLDAVIHMMVWNLWHNKWEILFFLIILFVTRKVIFQLIDTMVPNPKNPGRGHWLRRILLSKVTDKEGRLQRRFTGKLWDKRTSRVKDREEAYYNRRTERAAGLASLIKSILSLVFAIFGTFIMLAQLGITTSSSTNGWLMGAGSVALAFGTQNIIKDIVAGVHVLAEDQYGLGDYIDVQFGVAGKVTHIGLRTTRLKGADGTIYHIRHSEMPKIANLTQATGNLILDIELKWNDLPEDKKMIQSSDLKFAEERLSKTILELRNTLNAVDRVAASLPVPEDSSTVPLKKVAEVVPDLVPQLSTDTLVNMTRIATEDIETEERQREAHSQIVSAINKVPAPTPLFQEIEMMGLVNSEADTLTLRVKIKILSQESKAYALSVLRRKVFIDFAKSNISTKFEEVPEGIFA